MRRADRWNAPWLLLVGSLVVVAAFSLSWWRGVPPSEPASILFSGLLVLASLLLWRVTQQTAKTQEELRRWQQERADKLDKPRPYVVGRGKLDVISGQPFIDLQFLLSNAGAVPITILKVVIKSEQFRYSVPDRAEWTSLHPVVAAVTRTPQTALLTQGFPAIVLANGVTRIVIRLRPNNDSVRADILESKSVSLSLTYKAGGWPEDEVDREIVVRGGEGLPIEVPSQ